MNMAIINGTKSFAWDKSSWNKIGQFSTIALAFIIPISTFLTSIFAILALVAWLFGPHFRDKREIFLHHPMVQWLYPLVLISIVGMFYSPGDSYSIRHGMNDSLRLALIPIFIYFLQDKKVAQWALWGFIGAMVLTLFLSFLKVYAGLPIGLKFEMGAVFKCHIKTSFFMAMAAFFLATHARNNSQYRFPILLIVLLMVYYLLCMNVGRIGYISLVIVTILFAWQGYRFKGVLFAALVSCLFIAGAYTTSNLFSQRIDALSTDLSLYQEGGRLVESSLGSRITFAIDSMALIKERPLFGWGTGSFGLVYTKAHENIDTLLTDNPHNEYLRVGVEYGILGLFCLLLLFYQQWRLSNKLPKSVRDVAQAVLITFIIGCFLNSWLKDFTEGYFYCVMTALCFAWLPMPQTQKIMNNQIH